MPTFDWKCPKCKKVYINLALTLEEVNQEKKFKCEVCKVEMEKLPGAFSFVIK